MRCCSSKVICRVDQTLLLSERIVFVCVWGKLHWGVPRAGCPLLLNVFHPLLWIAQILTFLLFLSASSSRIPPFLNSKLHHSARVIPLCRVVIIKGLLSDLPGQRRKVVWVELMVFVINVLSVCNRGWLVITFGRIANTLLAWHGLGCAHFLLLMLSLGFYSFLSILIFTSLILTSRFFYKFLRRFNSSSLYLL